VSKYEVTTLGFDPLDGCMDRGADRKTKVKSKLNLKLNIIKIKTKVNALIT
jgi:hypothetical protein